MNTRTHTFKTFVGAAALATLLAACGGGGGSALYGGPPPNPHNGGNGPLQTVTLKGSPGFATSGGFTVYVFDADLNTPGQSACNGACAQNWPPVAASGTLQSPFGSIVRQDGSMQLTYKGRPLYTFAFDTQPGQTQGDGVNAFGGLWHIARP